MRHFAADPMERAYPRHYLELGKHPYRNFAEALHAEIESARPQRLVVVEPGDHRVLVQLRGAAKKANSPLEIRPDRHFLIDLDGFNQWAEASCGWNISIVACVNARACFWMAKNRSAAHGILKSDD